MLRFAFCFIFYFALSAFYVTSAATQFSSEFVVSLTEKDFVERTSDGKLWFIKFFAPWCGHCKKLAPAWAQLGDRYKGNANVEIAHVDCTEFKEICKTEEVKGYPTLKTYFSGKAHQRYQGQRDIDSLAKFVDTVHSELFAETTT
eukprot:g4324.t1